jgi:hypothetical protein
LTGEPDHQFTLSYRNLRPYVRWYEWGEQSIRQTVTFPGACGADSSPLVQVLADDNHAPYLAMPAEDLQRIYLWLDANAPFYGTYRDDAQQQQRQGELVPPPNMQ